MFDALVLILLILEFCLKLTNYLPINYTMTQICMVSFFLCSMHWLWLENLKLEIHVKGNHLLCTVKYIGLEIRIIITHALACWTIRKENIDWWFWKVVYKQMVVITKGCLNFYSRTSLICPASEFLQLKLQKQTGFLTEMRMILIFLLLVYNCISLGYEHILMPLFIAI